jgi:hypothetical protein
MAVTHLYFNDQTNHGRMLRRALQQLEESTESINDLISTMQLMLSGDGSVDAHFTYATTKFGFSNDADTHNAWLELLSLQSKLNVDTSVTNTKSALNQAFNKFR